MRTQGGADDSSASPLNMIHLLVIGLLLAFNLQQSEAQVGVCYNTPGKNEPPPAEVVALLEKHNIKRIRLFEPNQEILTALKGKDINVSIGIRNSEIIPLASEPTKAELWVQTNVKAYLPDVKIEHIIVGNDISTNNANSLLTFPLVDAMHNLQNVLSKEGLKQIKVTTTFDTAILRVPFTDSPSNISFAAEAQLFMEHILKFQSDNGAPFMVNLYPYYAHICNPQGLKLGNAIFNASDGNLFETMMNSMYSALEKKGYGSIDVIVAETGWPSACGSSASVENQKIYITNLLNQVKNGTSMKPNKPILTYLFSVFDENIQGVPDVEKHWGLFTPNKELKFNFTGPLIGV